MKQKIYNYETHLHTFPVSACAKTGVRESLEFYKNEGYAGVFITNHFLDENINIDKSLPYDERLAFYFSDYEQALAIGKEIGIDVFLGVEMSDWGTDFLVYGLDAAWYFAHPEIEGMDRVEQLKLLASEGALIVHAHPFRGYDCMKLFPKHVHAVETYNACRTDFENAMAEQYARNYNLTPFAGTDLHDVACQAEFGGMQTTRKIESEADFVALVKSGESTPFRRYVPGKT